MTTAPEPTDWQRRLRAWVADHVTAGRMRPELLARYDETPLHLWGPHTANLCGLCGRLIAPTEEAVDGTPRDGESYAYPEHVGCAPLPWPASQADYRRMALAYAARVLDGETLDAHESAAFATAVRATLDEPWQP